MIKTAIIGYGYAAKSFHVPLLLASDRYELTSICSSNPATQNVIPDVKIFRTPHALVKSNQIDLVVIATPNDSHYALAKLCLSHNKHVVIDKPMAEHSTQARELIQLADSRSLTLSVFHNRRWDNDFLTVKKLLDENRLGDIRFFESHFDRYRPVAGNKWREQEGISSGIWYDLGSHLLDQALVLFGRPDAITARCLTQREKTVATDYFHVQLHYQGMEAILHSSCFSAGPNIRFRIEGLKGTYIKHGLDPQEVQLSNGTLPGSEKYGIEDKEKSGIFYTEQGAEQVISERGRYPDFYLALAKQIGGEDSNAVQANEAALVIELIEIAISSSRENSTVFLK